MCVHVHTCFIGVYVRYMSDMWYMHIIMLYAVYNMYINYVHKYNMLCMYMYVRIVPFQPSSSKDVALHVRLVDLYCSSG